MAKRKIEQPEQEIRKLRLAADSTKDAKEMKRLQAVRLYYDGRAVSDIVQIMECGERSLFRWVADYQREGIAGLKSKYKGGNSAKLSREQKNEIREKLHTYRPAQVLSPEVRISQGEYWTVSDLRIAVQEWYGVTYQTATSYRTLLKECGFSLQRPERRYRSRASEAEIADFEAEVEKKVTDLLQDYPDLAILTMDEMSLYFQATLTRVWALKGQTPIVYLSPQRDHIHFYGALDVRNGREIALTTAEQTSEVTADFIRILLLLFSTQHILLLLDRAPWHKGDAVRQIVAENDRLELLYYPVACPDLNHQEHVWSQVRDQISHNHSYTRFQFLIDDFETYLNQNLFETNFMDKYGPPPNTAIFN